MREYKYDIILELTEINRLIHWPIIAESKQAAINKIDITALFRVISCERVNRTNKARYYDKEYNNMAFIDI